MLLMLLSLSITATSFIEPDRAERVECDSLDKKINEKYSHSEEQQVAWTKPALSAVTFFLIKKDSEHSPQVKTSKQISCYQRDNKISTLSAWEHNLG
jgi:hypothetical protein